MNRVALAVCLLSAALLAACAAQPIQRRDGSNSLRSFSVRDLAKGDIDNVVEIHQQEVIAALRTLTLKLYRRNPGEWRRAGFASAEDATTALFSPLPGWPTSPHANRDWEAALLDTWRPDYAGDRVGALMGGLLVMHMAAFGHRTEFYLLSEVDAQKLYNAARNTEAVAWKLASARDARGQPVLLSSGYDGKGVPNLSFEREFGKLIGIQDTLAKVIEDKNKRAIRFGVVNVASMVFLPI